MKALTLHQPWASLVAVGAKKIETRSWSNTGMALDRLGAPLLFPTAFQARVRHFCRSTANNGAHEDRGPGGRLGAVV